MRGMWHVVWFELRDRFAVLVASLFLGLLALMAPLLPAYRQWDTGDVRGVAALGAAGALLLFATLGVGSSILVGAVTSGREGFALGRPVGTLALWAGRFVAALVLGLLAPALALLPAGIAGAWPAADIVRGAVILLVSLLPILIAGGALLRLTVQARSAWLVILVVAMVIAAMVQLRLVIGPAIRLFGFESSRPCSLLTIPIVWAMALLMGSAVAAVRGRIDVGRAARWGAGTAVLALAVLTGLLATGFSWVSAFTPGDIVSMECLQSSPAGPWVVFSARASRGGFQSSVKFLADVQNGHWERLEQQWGPVSFSEDGRFLALAEFDDQAIPAEGIERVRVLDLRQPGADGLPTTVRTVPMSSTPREVVLSPHGTRLLTILGGHFTVHDVRSGRPLARVREQVAAALLAEVDDDGGVWLALPLGGIGDEGARGLVVRYLAPGARGTVEVWRIADLDPCVRVLHPAGEGAQELVALLVRDDQGGRTLVVRRVRTGEVLWSVAGVDPPTPKEVLPLDARNVVVTLGHGEHGLVETVALLTPEGPRWHHALEPARIAVVKPGPRPSTVTLGTSRSTGPGGWRTRSEVLDLATGKATPVGENIFPAGVFWWTRLAPRLAPAGNWGSRLFVRHGHELLVLAEDGKPTPVPFR